MGNGICAWNIIKAACRTKNKPYGHCSNAYVVPAREKNALTRFMPALGPLLVLKTPHAHSRNAPQSCSPVSMLAAVLSPLPSLPPSVSHQAVVE